MRIDCSRRIRLKARSFVLYRRYIDTAEPTLKWKMKVPDSTNKIDRCAGAIVKRGGAPRAAVSWLAKSKDHGMTNTNTEHCTLISIYKSCVRTQFFFLHHLVGFHSALELEWKIAQRADGLIAVTNFEMKD
jgi:hypothetical protein